MSASSCPTTAVLGAGVIGLPVCPTFGQSNPQRDVDFGQRSKGGHVRSCHSSQEFRRVLWKVLNPEALKEEFKVSAVFKNGPRFWVVHKTFVLKTGKMYTDKRDFGGIEAFYARTVKLPPDFGKRLVAYQEGSIARDTR